MIYCDNMEKRSIGNFLGVLVEIQLYMDNYAKEVMEVTKRNGGWRIKEMKRSYKKNGKKKKVKSVGKSSSKYYICCKGKFYICFSFAHVASSHNIMCSKHFVFFHSLSWVVTVHRSYSSLLIHFSYLLLFFPCFVVYMFDRVLLFKIFLLFFGGRRINITHLFEGLYEWHKFNYQDNKKLVYYFALNLNHSKKII